MILTIDVAYSQQLFINEMMSNNVSSIQDNDGDYSDWIELYNPATSAVSMQGYHLTDEIQYLDKWQIPNTAIVGGGYLLIFASGKNLGQPEFHTNFSVSSSGESIYLVDPTGVILDSCPSVSLLTDQSYARISDCASTWIVSSLVTPGSENFVVQVPNFIISQPSGIYEDSVVLNVSCDIPGDIRYTIDGSVPIISDPIFPNNLVLINKSADQNELCMIPSSVVFTPPTDTIFKINTVRYALFDSGIQVSKTQSSSYLIDLNYSLPIVSILTDSENLFSADSGAYVPGPNPGTGPWYSASNFYQENNKVPAYFEYINKDKELVISQNVGIKLHGGLTRTYSQKSIKIIASTDYGLGEMEYDFFGENGIGQFDRIILRNGGQDYGRAIIRDAFVSRVSKNLNLETMNAQPTIVFLNGEYWGIHILREKIDEHHLENLFGIHKDSIDYLQGNGDVIEGTDTAYQNMMNFISNNDLSVSSNYDHVSNLMDVENFIDYYLVEIFYNNREWPHNNIKYYKPQTPDGKWRWILFDTDITSAAWSACAADKCPYLWLSDTLGYPAWSRIMFLKLIENNSFKDDFVNRFADLKNSNLQKANQLAVLHGLRDELSPEMDEHLERWNHIPSQQDWLNRVGVVENFINFREDYVRTQTRNFFLLGDTTVTVVLVQNIEGAGEIKFSTLEHSSLPWTGIYYKTTTIEMKASPFSGYEFSHWLETGNTDSIQFITLNADTTFTAVFNLISGIATDIVINEFQAKNTNGITDLSGEYVDWIELYNNGVTNIDLNQLYLSDNLNQPCKWKVNLSDTVLSILKPGDYFSFYADNDPSEGELHCNFSLSLSGEELAVSQIQGLDTVIIDSFTYNNAISNVSIGRFPDGVSNFRNFTIPSFNSVNQIKPLIAGLYINEVLAKNDNDITDSQGDNEDWIEIYNENGQDVDLGGYFLSDDVSNPTKWKIPNDINNLMEIDSEGFVLFFADDSIEVNKFHLPFKISLTGEVLSLSFLDNQNVITIDQIEFGQQTEDVSYGCYPDGNSNKMFFEITTPGISNSWSFINIDNEEYNETIIYPNPFNESITVKSNWSETAEYFVCNLLGEILLSGFINSKEQFIDLRSLPSNMYLFTLKDKTYKLNKL